MSKLGVIVPYRDRPEQLEKFKKHINTYLKGKSIDYVLIVAEQEFAGPFNRGRLLNAGFKQSKKLGCNYVALHDVDLLPIDVDYTYEDHPVHLVGEYVNKRENKKLFYDYFGGVTLFPSEQFERVNGFSNDYPFWGYEDDDLLLRCKELGLKLDYEKPIQPKFSNESIYLNGNSDYITLDNFFRRYREFTIVVNFLPYSFPNWLSNQFDEMSIFSFPGRDTTMFYNSFFRIGFTYWNKYEAPSSLYSEKSLPRKYQAAISFKRHEKGFKFDMYVNGTKVDEGVTDSRKFTKIENLYIGVGNPDRSLYTNYFHGEINSFSVFDRALEIDSLFESSELKKAAFYLDSLNVNKYNSNLQTITTKNTLDRFIIKPIRKNGLFDSLPHSDNGFSNYKWKDHMSRINQINYLKKLYNKTDYKSDGIDSNGGFKVIETSENFSHIKV